jgi:hypothetical protein
MFLPKKMTEKFSIYGGPGLKDQPRHMPVPYTQVLSFICLDIMILAENS